MTATDTRRPEVEARPYVVISTDGHCGADLWGYKPYLESKYHEEFDAWAREFADPWNAVDEVADSRRVGVASYTDSYNWDGPRRTEHMDSQGIAAEVLFPNTAPPFYPTNSISAPGPRDAKEYEYRSAGLRAHNRWAADFCAEEPARRAGLAQFFIYDVDDAVAEIRRAKEAGFKGVLLPGDHVLQTCNLYYPKYEPIWGVCEELDIPLHRHGVLPTEAATAEAGDASPTIGMLESRFFATRSVTHLVMSGVFDRHPGLKLVMTENTAAWSIERRQFLDQWYDASSTPGTLAHIFGADALAKLSKRPSEYMATNVWYGTFLTDQDMEHRHEIGVDRMMWGADFPHHEGTSPFTTKALRANFAGVPEDEVRAMLSDTAVKVYGLDLPSLEKVADRIGPSVDEINVPLAEDEVPRFPDESMCPTFGLGASWGRPED
jgi:predicted TIM-barrel fold metal-dependent hydrolase